MFYNNLHCSCINLCTSSSVLCRYIFLFCIPFYNHIASAPSKPEIHLLKLSTMVPSHQLHFSSIPTLRDKADLACRSNNYPKHGHLDMLLFLLAAQELLWLGGYFQLPCFSCSTDSFLLHSHQHLHCSCHIQE